MTAQRYSAAHLYQEDRWLSPGYFEIDDDGRFTAVAATRPASWAGSEHERLDGYVVPGVPNLHSHAFHRAYSLFAEGPTGAARDDLWTWRAGLYELAARIEPDQLEAVAAMAFLEMLRGGFTSVGEFHYLHHDPSGRPYANPAELAERILAAADAVGIAITLLPVLYRHGGFDQPIDGVQRRFAAASVDAFGRSLAALRGSAGGRAFLGVAPHSLRAVHPEDLRALLQLRAELLPDTPIHIHAAEQRGEVEGARAALGMGPIAWLIEHASLDGHWTVIHATHATAEELDGLARSGATVALCPVTEADLGDGLFALGTYVAAGGHWGIGSDANLSIDPAIELRTLLYGQRLRHERRDALGRRGTGRALLAAALASGAASLGQPIGGIVVGQRADLLELDPQASGLLGHTPATVLDAWIFGAGARAVRRVMVGGRWRITAGGHPEEERIRAGFAEAVRGLREAPDWRRGRARSLPPGGGGVVH